MVGAGCGVGQAKRAIDSVAVLELNVVVRWTAVLIMAVITEVMGTKAIEEGDVAAVHTFPVNLLFAMLFAFF